MGAGSSAFNLLKIYDNVAFGKTIPVVAVEAFNGPGFLRLEGFGGGTREDF